MTEWREPDYRIATIVLWLSTGVNVLRKAGVDFEVLERARLLTDELYQAVAVRGVRIGEIVEAIRAVKPMGSILDDLDTVRPRRGK